MNPMIKILFEYIERMEDEIDRLKKGKNTLATLNPQIPEPYASMSRDEILGGIGQYEICNI